MKKILVFGGSGLVGSKFIDLNSKTFEIKAPAATEVDILNKDQILAVTKEFDPDTIINFAAYTNVEQAENQKGDKNGICFQINAIGAKNVAEACRGLNKHLIHISTEYVFDGTKENSPYIEADTPNPINWYGTTKLFGEGFVLESGCKSSVIRISMPYSCFYELKKDIARFFVEQLKLGKVIKAVEDQRITPTLVDDIANALVVVIQSESNGTYHVSSSNSVTPLGFAKTIAEVFKLDYSLISSMTLDEFNQSKTAKLLKYSWLNPIKFEKTFGDQILHTVEEDLIIFKKEIDRKTDNQI